MKVVLVNTSESKGGAAVACKRLYSALNQSGIDCKLLVLHKSSEDPNVIVIPTSKIKRTILSLLFSLELVLQRLFKNKNTDYSFSIFGINLSNLKEVQEADVIHLHWIHNSFIQIKDLNNLLHDNKKIVWTMHDMWAFTGGCHYAGDCTKYQTSCNNCPQLKSNTMFDFAKNQFEKKSKLDLNSIKFITPSAWLSSIARGSSLLKDSKVIPIPNGIDTTNKIPIEKAAALKILGLSVPVDEKIFLFIAMNANDPRKGFATLEDSLQIWTKTHKQKATLLIVGRLSSPISINSDFITVVQLGRIFDENKINAAYSCADAFLMPSKQDNLPNTIMESLTFGTPIVAFPTGGIPEMILHNKTGYIALINNSKSFADGIQWAYNNSGECRKDCRAYAINNYSYPVIAKMHLTFYEEY